MPSKLTGYLHRHKETAYPITDAVAVDGVVNQVQTGGIVDNEGPEVFSWDGQLECDGVVVASRSIQARSRRVNICLEVDDL